MMELSNVLCYDEKILQLPWFQYDHIWILFLLLLTFYCQFAEYFVACDSSPCPVVAAHWAVDHQVMPSSPNWSCSSHDDVIKWKHFSRYWPIVWGIHRWLVNSPHKVQWRGALMFSLIYAWINGWVNNREAGDLRHHRSHFDVIAMPVHNAFHPFIHCLMESPAQLTHSGLVML